MIKYSAKDIKNFANIVWMPKKWQRGLPTRQIRNRYYFMLSCIKSINHRKIGKKYWRDRKKAYFEYRTYKKQWGDCTDAGPVRDCIHGAAIEYGADERWMISVSWCESEWKRYAQNPSGSTSIFQFLYSTWLTTPYGNKDIYSVKYQSLAAAWMYVQNRQSEWVCSS